MNIRILQQMSMYENERKCTEMLNSGTKMNAFAHKCTSATPQCLRALQRYNDISEDQIHIFTV
jgi:hypothetical protein